MATRTLPAAHRYRSLSANGHTKVHVLQRAPLRFCRTGKRDIGLVGVWL